MCSPSKIRALDTEGTWWTLRWGQGLGGRRFEHVLLDRWPQNHGERRWLDQNLERRVVDPETQIFIPYYLAYEG